MATAEKVAIRRAEAAEAQTAAVKSLESHLKRLEKTITVMDEKIDALLAAQSALEPAKAATK